MADCKEPIASKMKLREHLEEFAGYTTLHGLHFVFGSGGAVRRLIWLILVLAGLGFCTKQLIVSFLRMQAHQAVISKAIVPSRQLTFPAVTICNRNMMKKSLIKGKDAQVYIDNLNMIIKKRKTLNMSFDIQKAVEEYGHNVKGMINSCSWNGASCSHLNFTTRFSYLYGLCHTFNSGKPGHPLLYSTSAERSRGLVLNLDSEAYERYGMTSYFDSGIRFMVHDQHDEPMIENEGITATGNHMTTVIIQRMEYNSLQYPYQSECGSKKLITSEVYSRITCLVECNTRKFVAKCGCKLLGMPNITESKQVRFCSLEEMIDCGVYTKTDSSSNHIPLPDYKVFLNFGYNLTTHDPLECGCPRSCKEITYSTRLDISNFISADLLVNDLSNYYNKINGRKMTKKEADAARSQIRENNLLLNIHYKDLNTYVTSEVPSYDINSFGADVGGYIGLFLGCSVLTVFEFIDLVIVYCLKKQRGNTANETMRSKEEPKETIF